MALTNLILTAAGIGAVFILMRSDVRQSAAIFKQNLKHIQIWLEKESASASKAAANMKPKQVESKAPPKD